MVLIVVVVASLGGTAGLGVTKPVALKPVLTPHPTVAPLPGEQNSGWKEIGASGGGPAGSPAATAKPTADAGTGGASASGAFLAPRVELSSCGDGTCNADEACGNCAADCGCAGDKYCTAQGTCDAVEQCGDAICTSLESGGNCCTDCGCTKGNFCNYAKDSCVSEPKVNKTQLDASIKSFIAGSSRSYTDYSVYSEVFKGTPVTVANFVCNSGVPGKNCRTVVYFDTRGEVMLVGNSK